MLAEVAIITFDGFLGRAKRKDIITIVWYSINMKYILTIFLILYTFSIKAEISACKFSPLTLSNTDDWEKFKIQEWHNCFGELYQNYKNKKKWITFFKDGLPNGYGTVKYDNSDGYFEGFFLNGKMHGEGKFIDNNGINLDLKCLHNSCQILNKSAYENKKLNTHIFSDLIYKNIQIEKSKYYKENFYALSESIQKNNQSNTSSDNFKINNISPINGIFSINKLILNNKIQPSIQSKQIIPMEKIFKYTK